VAKKRTPKGRGEVEQLPSGKFRAVVSRVAVVEGVKRRVRASKTFPKRKDAWDWLDAQGRGGPVAAQTVGEWLTAWLDIQRAAVTAKSLDGDAQKVRQFLHPAFGPARLRDLDGTAVAAWLAGLKAAGASDSARQGAGACLRKCLNAAVAHKVIAANPMTGVVKLPTPRRAEKAVMSVPEMLAVVAAAEDAGLGHVARLWFDAGLRPGEMFALDWGDIDPVAGTVTVRRAMDGKTNEVKDAKTAKSRRTLPLSAPTLAALAAARPPGGGVVLPNASGGRWWASNFAEHVGIPLLEAAGLKGRGFDRYTFRHTMASVLLSAGVSVLIVSRRLGHGDAAMTLRVYGHLMPGDAGRAADAMGGAFGGPAPR